MADSFVRVPADSVGKKVDATSLDVGADTVYRQRIVVGDNAATAEFATVLAGALKCFGTFSIGGTPTVNVNGGVAISGTAVVAGVVTLGATAAVTGTVALAAGTANIGTINNISSTVTIVGVVSFAAGTILDSISATVGVKGQVSLAAGTSNIGFINNISATVVVSGTVSLGASTAVIGTLNNISATVTVAGNITVDKISAAVVLAAGSANIGTLNNISATVVVSGNVTVDKISATATAIIGGFLDPSGQQRNVVDSANTALRVNVVAGSSGGVSQVDGTSFTSQAANFVPIGGIFDDAATDTLSENDAGVVRLTTNRGFHVNLRTDGGTKMDDSTNSALRVNVVAGGAGGGAVFGQVSAGASLSVTNVPVLMGGNDSVGGGIARTLLLDTSGRIILGAGANNIGTINNISAAIVLAAGANNIGTINNISATIGITGTVALVAGTVINNISATVIVAGVVSLGAGTNNIGFLDKISATVIVAGEIANGSSLSTTNKPVLMGGNDSAGGAGGVARTLLLDTSGRIILGAGTNNVGAVSLAAGTANIGFINNISATIAAVLAAGTANIGTINNISAAVVLAAGTANIGAVSNAAGTALMGAVSLAAGTANIGFINNISATVVAAISGGIVAHSLSVTAGNAPLIMGMRAHLSASAAVGNKAATYTWGDKFGRQVIIKNHPSLLQTASHGPKCVTVSTSATVALVAAPGAGLSVFVTQIACTNGSATLTRADAYPASATASCVTQMYMAASGGGFVQNFDPPVQILSNTALNSRVKPNVSQAIFVVHFYVGPK